MNTEQEEPKEPKPKEFIRRDRVMFAYKGQEGQFNDLEKKHINLHIDKPATITHVYGRGLYDIQLEHGYIIENVHKRFLTLAPDKS